MTRCWTPVLFLLGLGAGCVPDLTGEAEEPYVWTEPTNSWPVQQPPEDLTGEGFFVGQVPFDFRLLDQHGDEVSLWQFYGDVILMDISTMWCGPCQQIAEDVDETWKDYAEEGFTYLTILPEDHQGGSVDNDDLNQWADNFEITSPILADTEGYGYTVEPEQVWPVVMLIDRKMKVLVERVSPNDHSIREAIEDAL